MPRAWGRSIPLGGGLRPLDLPETLRRGAEAVTGRIRSTARGARGSRAGKCRRASNVGIWPRENLGLSHCATIDTGARQHGGRVRGGRAAGWLRAGRILASREDHGTSPRHAKRRYTPPAILLANSPRGARREVLEYAPRRARAVRHGGAGAGEVSAGKAGAEAWHARCDARPGPGQVRRNTDDTYALQV